MEGLKKMTKVHESVAGEVFAWSLPNGELKSTFGGDAFMKKSRAGTYYKYIKHEES